MIPLDFWHTTVGPEFFGAVLFLALLAECCLIRLLLSVVFIGRCPFTDLALDTVLSQCLFECSLETKIIVNLTVINLAQVGA